MAFGVVFGKVIHHAAAYTGYVCLIMAAFAAFGVYPSNAVLGGVMVVTLALFIVGLFLVSVWRKAGEIEDEHLADARSQQAADADYQAQNMPLPDPPIVHTERPSNPFKTVS